MKYVKMNMGLFLIALPYVLSNNIKMYNVKPCDGNVYYPITVDNVQLEIKDGYVYVFGSLTSDVDIKSPVKAALVAKKYINTLNIWVDVPCVNNLGSCPISDLCHFGLPANHSCPNHFVEDKVPCRCPIPEGTYEMKPEHKIALLKLPEKMYFKSSNNHSEFPWSKDVISYLSPLAGTYWVQASISHNGELLTCYQCYIDYSDNFSENEIEPIVELIF